MDAEKHCASLRNNRGFTARQLDRRSEQARQLNSGEQKLLKTTLGRLESKEKKSVKLLRRTTEDLKKTLHELNMAGNSVKVWMDLEARNATNGGCHLRSTFANVDENGGKAGLSEYSRYRLPRISSAAPNRRRGNDVLTAKGAGPRRYSENDLTLASQLLQLKLKNDVPSSESDSESVDKARGLGYTSTPPGSNSPKILGDKFPGKHAWIGGVYKTDSPRDSPQGSPRDSPRNSPKLFHRTPDILHRSVSTESLGLKSLSNASLSEISVDVTVLPDSPIEQHKCLSSPRSPQSPFSSVKSQAADEGNIRTGDRPDTPAYIPRPPPSPRIPIPNIKISQSSRMQPVLELADADSLVPTSPLNHPSPSWPSASSPASEWRAEKPLRDARRKVLLNLPATFAALSRRRHSSPESQDEAVKICRERFSEMLDKRRASEQTELQAKVKEFLEKTISSSSSNSSSEPAIDG
ncbi:uncharacterized protein LOC119745279 [Patiria miniata]|uniref:Uncharacterized protein n=1 Tax=Patiria miniata TaxID=46514 RepID=A0A914BMD6_PATMI|nr:uncharacterized protein LOC119745279 [Patiria miniata]